MRIPTDEARRCHFAILFSPDKMPQHFRIEAARSEGNLDEPPVPMSFDLELARTLSVAFLINLHGMN